MVTGLWVGAVLGLLAGLAAPALALALGPGVLVAELQALTVTMAVATNAGALSLLYGLAAISSLTSMCLLSLALASELQIPPQKAIPGPSLHPQSSSVCRPPEGAVGVLGSIWAQPGGGVRRQEACRQLGAGE